ncbi:DUF5680 domain-containing protein [Rhizobium oryzicola]|uniref:DUF5680 domain-containing protein n=1 Tax=Rhizobium oryzicola TaxID=1232668 RepID=A0ABT8SVB9_9HYPH|nr:DUF5680 domain-containing protein [Rhizobium oryzicola]MDO1582003.1 DUF5680 domain-containing protein [Rhizobium oryzicola]
MDESRLNQIIVTAKAATYVGGGRKSASCRVGSHDLSWQEGEWRYLDSYFGGTDFIGQEVLWHGDTAVWAMNYYGYILRPDLIDGERAGWTIKAALSALYQEQRFLGGFEWIGPYGRYLDSNDGNASHFSGREIIEVEGDVAYALDYCGGLIKD